MQKNLRVEGSDVYTLSFWAKADQGLPLKVDVGRAQSSFGGDGLSEEVWLGPEWQEITLTLLVTANASDWQISFGFPSGAGEVFLANVSLQSGSDAGLPEAESLEARNVSLPAQSANLRMRQDFRAFLADTEQAYVREMIDFLRNELHVKVPITDSQVSWGGLMGWIREGTLSDYLNGHAYWGHPKFKGRAFGMTGWTIENQPMTSNRPGSLAHLSWQRMFGKPYVVSEYGHPFPTDYAAEIYPMIFSYAARQDWAGVFQFNYANGRRTRADFEEGAIGQFFEGCLHPVKRAFIPTAAILFRMGKMPVAEPKIEGIIPIKGLPERTILEGKYLSIPGKHKDAMLDFRVGVKLEDREGEITWSEVPARTPEDPEPIVWTVDPSSKPKGGQYLINVPAVRMAMGTIGGEIIQLGDCSIEVTNGPKHWAAVAVTSLDGEEISKSKRILITITGNAENTGMVWNEERTTLEDRRGTAPVTVESIHATITLPGSAKVHALDTNGAIRNEIPVTENDGKLVMNLGGKHETLWFAVERP